MDNENKKYSIGKYFSFFKASYNAVMWIIMVTENKKMALKISFYLYNIFSIIFCGEIFPGNVFVKVSYDLNRVHWCNIAITGLFYRDQHY